MQKRRLGRTEQRSTVVTFGAFSVGYLDQEEADRVIEMVLGHGVNHIDIAPSYGEAMERMAPWMPEIRGRMFLGSKTGFRSRDEAWRDRETAAPGTIRTASRRTSTGRSGGCCPSRCTPPRAAAR